MATYEREVREHLTAHGCRLDRQGRGDHEIWYSPITKRKFTVDGKNPATPRTQ
jgi:hypothetical protein